MSSSKGNCIIGQSGGPTVAINSSLSGIISEALKSNRYGTIYGMINGIEGLLNKKILNLSSIFNNEKSLKQLKYSPAMYLGSCRFKLLPYEGDPNLYTKLFDIFKSYNIKDFFYIGGNDSMDTVMKLSDYAKTINYDINIIGIPKTIDNDLAVTDHTPGFGSAAKFIATSVLEITYDSMIYDTNSVTIIEVMGRNAGWLTAASALAKTETLDTPDFIYLPEKLFDKNKFLEDIESRFKIKRNLVVVVSEGLRDTNGKYISDNPLGNSLDSFGHTMLSGIGSVLADLVKQKFKCKVRSIELNVCQRCAMHVASQTDLNEAFKVGEYAVRLASDNKTGQMVTLSSDSKGKITIDSTDITKIANLEKRVPIEWINERGNYVTKELYDYIRPLILGEVNIPYKNGIPDYIDINHLLNSN